MADINTELIQKLAKLSSLELSSDELASMTTEIQNIVGFVDQLQSVDVTGLEPTYQVTGLEDVLRADDIAPVALNRDELLANAPDQKDGYIKVPRVL